MKTLVSATIVLISLTGAMAQSSSGTSVAWPAVPQQQPGTGLSAAISAGPVQASRKPEASSVAMVGDQVLLTGDLEDQARQSVLVVPGPDLKPETLAAITEDLTVMCRILDKTLYPGKRGAGASIYLKRPGSLGSLFLPQTGRTQGLYLDGYGALFFVQVDFPLIAPPEQKQEAKPDESVDQVWSQTVNEVRGQEEPRDAVKGGPAYDARRVENLKATLIKTLRHAANLRVRPEDQVTLVVGSQGPATGSGKEHFSWFYSQQHWSVGPTKNRTGPDNPVPDPAATLVLRVSKADVDALSAGKLTADQFAPKVQVLWAAAQPQAQEPQAPPATPAQR